MTSIETLFRSLACVNGSFLKPNDEHMCCTIKNHGLDIADAEVAFGYIRKMENLSLKSIVRKKGIGRPLSIANFEFYLNEKNSPILHRFGKELPHKSYNR